MRNTILIMISLTCIYLPVLGQNNLGDIVNIVTGGGTDGRQAGLGNDTIVKGLLEALEVGTGNAVAYTSKMDGFLSNEAIKILLPEDIQKAESLIRMAGGGKALDEFVVSMNRAAEMAAPEARALFTEAIRGMTFSDAKKILKGRDNEATLYFKESMSDRLFEKFEPLVKDTMEKTEVTRQYKSIEKIVSSLPVGGLSGFNLDKYVTQKALDGLFHVVAEEERKIRQDPSARVSDILKTVFGQ